MVISKAIKEKNGQGKKIERRMPQDLRKHIRVSIALAEFAEMTGCLPEVASEAVIRFQREGNRLPLTPANRERFW